MYGFSRVDLTSVTNSRNLRTAFSGVTKRFVLFATFAQRSGMDKRRSASWQSLVDQAKLVLEVDGFDAQLQGSRRRGQDNPRLLLYRLERSR